jgi:hypothetical protein
MKSDPMTKFEDPSFPMRVDFDKDGLITIEWDETHPVTSIFNDWTEKDFIDTILGYCRKVLEDTDEKGEVV